MDRTKCCHLGLEPATLNAVESFVVVSKSKLYNTYLLKLTYRIYIYINGLDRILQSLVDIKSYKYYVFKVRIKNRLYAFHNT